MTRTILIIATIWLAVSAYAVEPLEKSGPPVSMYGIGAKETCGSFVRSLNTPNYIRYFDYSAGFVTAQNMRPDSGGNILSGADLNDAMLVVEKYCRDNPMTGFINGLNHLIKNLKNQSE
ncbi:MULTISPECIES: hypothetical protein [unclassified Pseudomonas]|uniref:hypothetical protein n=1 Tax=unclassified Pseudomonas TaxID=196821 RepID=UPI00224935B7|nr:hypothetical protein [Pseudomonas sp. DCB_BG]MCX2708344.1 hypothetical protein [Pseudomonas sp. DCB_BG]